jgi:hypothetical protein
LIEKHKRFKIAPKKTLKTDELWKNELKKNVKNLENG